MRGIWLPSICGSKQVFKEDQTMSRKIPHLRIIRPIFDISLFSLSVFPAREFAFGEQAEGRRSQTGRLRAGH